LAMIMVTLEKYSMYPQEINLYSWHSIHEFVVAILRINWSSN